MGDTTEPLQAKDVVTFLFRTVTRPDGCPYTPSEVSAHLSISSATINQLMTGKIKNPTLPTATELCRFFDTSLDIFQCKTYDECYAVLARRHVEPGSLAAEIGMRALGLSPENRQLLLRIISWVEAAERECYRNDRSAEK